MFYVNVYENHLFGQKAYSLFQSQIAADVALIHGYKCIYRLRIYPKKKLNPIPRPAEYAFPDIKWI